MTRSKLTTFLVNSESSYTSFGATINSSLKTPASNVQETTAGPPHTPGSEALEAAAQPWRVPVSTPASQWEPACAVPRAEGSASESWREAVCSVDACAATRGGPD